uniref:Uncharacterized protein LOC111112098 isoform X1 n=1 Tax=Crassostrea virginica TaxID=6565 RepID=A0A8B8BQH0_CRAVI|nr:uncharacterized protein LOC111112098 isoform X1 [Crassostrea virginica]
MQLSNLIFLFFKELEHIQDILRDRMTCTKPVHGSIFTKYRTLVGLQNEDLNNIFVNYPLMAAHYLALVLLKEAVIFLTCVKTGMPYEEANKKCCATERTVKKSSHE